ncbi:MAG TPA: FumA C-terminus/TtdB family hydratase beta subunit [bacterium]|nr:FumA C-terminus/TtdB family hydratase beta subunit [bacterium]
MNPRELRTPLGPAEIGRLHAGDEVLLSGVIYTARDAAHERLTRLLAAGDPLPVDLGGEIIYYCGPTPARPGRPIGSAGPTTASRMDPHTPALLAHGVRGMIGKGRRSAAVKDAIRRFGAVYFAAVEGTAALLGRSVRSAEVVAFPDLGAEAIYRLVVERFPVVVANDCHGGDVYEDGLAKFRR